MLPPPVINLVDTTPPKIERVLRVPEDELYRALRSIRKLDRFSRAFEATFTWPSDEDIKAMPRDLSYSVKSLNWQTLANDPSFICSLGLTLANGASSPMYCGLQTKLDDVQKSELASDCSGKVSVIRVKRKQAYKSLQSIRLIDKHSKTVAEAKPSGNLMSVNSWSDGTEFTEERTLFDGEQLIGI